MATFGSTIAQDDSTSAARWIAPWLFAMAGLVLVMVLVGGATRLTGSGLSITEWQPIVGALPPLSDAAWADAFDKYRQIPQYKLLNKGMSLEAFKGIYWWEWGHRFLGRLLGLAFLVPLVFFIWRGAVRGSLTLKLGVLFVLGGAQGALGWYMVKSGLSQRTDVSQYRLAAHLVLASVLFAALLWIALGQRVATAGPRIRLKTLASGAPVVAMVLVLLVLAQIGAGALVAGLKAGLTYNTWPLMDGRLIPNGLGTLTPVWLNLVENPTAVQFDHRLLAYMIAVLAVWHTMRVLRSADDEHMRRSAGLLLAVVLLQVALGIWTLLTIVPLSLALAHQGMAMLVLAVAVFHAHGLWQD